MSEHDDVSMIGGVGDRGDIQHIPLLVSINPHELQDDGLYRGGSNVIAVLEQQHFYKLLDAIRIIVRDELKELIHRQ